MDFFDNLPWVLGALLTSLGFVVFGLLMLYFVKRSFSNVDLKASHDVVGFAYGVIGVVYAVLVGFNVVNVQERFNDAIKISEAEANAVADLYRDAYTLPHPYDDEIRTLLVEYIDKVLKEEWPLMTHGKTSDSVIKVTHALWFTFYKIKPTTEQEKIWLSESISRLNEFTNLRLSRIYNSNDSLSPMMWVILYVGAAITLGFLSFFSIKQTSIHVIITVALATMIGSLLYLIQALDGVYYGGIAVRPQALEEVQHFLQKWY